MNIGISFFQTLPSREVYVRRVSTGILAHAATFLAAPSRALLAVALDENSAAQPNERSSAIVGNHWDVLDFGGIEKKVAANLEDSDVKRVLLCINAVNRLKRLKLTNCAAITGTCFEPLRGSLVIEQIDLSVVYDTHQPDLNPEPLISLEHVLPILDSIIAREDCALMHLHFPSMWRKAPSNDSDFHAFIGRYNRTRTNRGTVRCLGCNSSLPENVGDEWIGTATVGTDYYGIQLHTCYGCLKHYCYDCNIDGNEEDSFSMLHECGVCRLDYCKSCSVMTECSVSGCDVKICNDCCKYECVKCDKEFCSKCIQNGKNVNKCEYCDKCYCQECNEYDVIHIYTCGGRCDVKCCDDCRFHRYRQGQQHCTDCIKQIADLLVDESVAQKQLQEDYELLKVEMEGLKRQIEELKHKNRRS